MAKTRLSSAAQSRRYVDRTDVDFGCSGGGSVIVGGGGASADGAVASTGGRGTSLARRRLVGAKTPWKRVRFAYVGGINGTSFLRSSTPLVMAFAWGD